jgi:hypothetical protein
MEWLWGLQTSGDYHCQPLFSLIIDSRFGDSNAKRWFKAGEFFRCTPRSCHQTESSGLLREVTEIVDDADPDRPDL